MCGGKESVSAHKRSPPPQQAMPAQRGSRQCEGGEPALRKATCRNDLREALAALYDGAAHGRDRSGKGALHYAAERGYFSVLFLLLQHGLDPNIRDGGGLTPLRPWTLQNTGL